MRHFLLRTSILVLAFGLFSANAAVGAATTESHAIDIDYDRDRIGYRSTERPSISQPAAGSLPPELVRLYPSGATAIELPSGASRQVEDHTVHEPGERSGGDGLETRAAVAATWTVRQKTRIFGRRELYQAGFFDGLQEAFHDPLIGDWDYRQGHRAGLHDRDAHETGTGLGLLHAERSAGEDAYARITAQFHDLSHEPRPGDRPATPAFSAPLPEVREPRLMDVFEQRPLSSFLEKASTGPLPDPFKLYRYNSYSDFYDRSWTEPEQALEYWLDHNRDGAFWHQLTGEDRALFTDIFRSIFSGQLPDVLAGAGERAYAEGHGEGWSYAVSVAQEWSHRRGFREGFISALHEHAQSAFNDRYPSLFDDRYAELFHEWSTTAKPEISKVVVDDGSGDGVFEPGEKVLAHYELVNYGGRGERFMVRLDGAPLKASAAADVYLPRRQVFRSHGPLAAHIDPGVPSRTPAELELTVGGLGRRVAFRIAYPLELDGRVMLGFHDTQTGRARVDVAIGNYSRLPAGGMVELLVDGGSVPAPARRFDHLEAGASHRLSFPIAGLDPLDLLDGEVELNFVVRGLDASGHEAIFDHLEHRLPELASNRDNREVSIFMQEAVLGQRPTLLGLGATASRGERTGNFGGAFEEAGD